MCVAYVKAKQRDRERERVELNDTSDDEMKLGTGE